MPELPEVETVVRTLETLIPGRRIDRACVLYPKIVVPSPQDFCSRVQGRHFLEFGRRGKYLIFTLEDGYLTAHLRMEGKFYIKTAEEPWDRHTHLQFFLDDGRRLDYHDTRKFGRLEVIEKQTDLRHFKGLGPEPFSDEFNEAWVAEWFQKRTVPIKTMLMDQRFVAGIGNIYADEICFAMRLHPLTPCGRLGASRRKRLIEVIREQLTKAIQAGGSTVRSYTSSLGVTGLFQLQIQVYGQAGKPCPICGTTLRRMTVHQRGTCYCPQCQRKR